MDVLIYLIPVALVLGFLWLVSFMWALKNGQFDDCEGSAVRILMDDMPENAELTEVKMPASDV